MAGKVAGFTADDSIPLTTYDTSLFGSNHMQFASVTLNTCSSCPGISHLKDRLLALMDDNLVDQWVSVECSTLETFCKSDDDFADVFCEKLEVLLPQFFIAKNNSQATIYPFVTHYMVSGKLHHVSYAVISDGLCHDTVTVHLFQKSCGKFLKVESWHSSKNNNKFFR